MKIALIGYGRMGKELEKKAISKGHSISLVIDKDNLDDLNKKNLSSVDVALEFTTPQSAPGNIIKCVENGVPVVCGSTGWNDRFDEVCSIVEKHDGTLVYASNFSIGVNIMFYLNRRLAEIIKEFDGYNPSILEIHHTAKLDAPSGTAVTLAGDIIKNSELDDWSGGSVPEDKKLHIRSERTGSVPGIHEVKWESSIDAISLRHEAFNRMGFVDGAIFAAERSAGMKGIITMKDLMGF